MEEYLKLNEKNSLNAVFEIAAKLVQVSTRNLLKSFQDQAESNIKIIQYYNESNFWNINIKYFLP